MQRFLKSYNKVVKYAPPFQGCAGQPNLRFVCPLPRR